VTKIPDEKVVAGLSCGEVLAHLSDYLDGELEAPFRQRLEAHLAGCEGCARFGGELQATVRALKLRLSSGAALPARVRERLHRSLDGEPGPGR
jgi:anti-sigma factor (TIGR02949 family)